MTAKRVIFRFVVSDAGTFVQFRFLVPRKDFFYDLNVQPVVDRILEIVPEGNRKHHQGTGNWQVRSDSWPKIEHLISTQGFRLVAHQPEPSSFETHLRDLPLLLIYPGAPLLVVAFILSIAKRIFHYSYPVELRPLMFLALATLAFVTTKLGRYLDAAVSFSAALLLNPILGLYVKNWLVWELINLALIAFFVYSSFKCMAAAEAAKNEQYGWCNFE